MSDGATVLDMTDENTRNFYLYATWRSAIRLEKVGLKHSSGRSVRKYAALHLGMKATAKADDVIAELTTRIAEIKWAREAGTSA